MKVPLTCAFDLGETGGGEVVGRSEASLDVRFRFLEDTSDQLPALRDFRDTFIYLEQFFWVAEFLGRERMEDTRHRAGTERLKQIRKSMSDTAVDAGVRTVSYNSPLEVVVGVGALIGSSQYIAYGVFRLVDIYARTRERLAEMGAITSRDHYHEEYYEALREQLHVQGIDDADPRLTQDVEAAAAVMNSVEMIEIVGPRPEV